MATATYTPPPPPVEGRVNLNMTASEAGRLRALLRCCSGSEEAALAGLEEALSNCPDVPRMQMLVANPLRRNECWARGSEPFSTWGSRMDGPDCFASINLHTGLVFKLDNED